MKLDPQRALQRALYDLFGFWELQGTIYQVPNYRETLSNVLFIFRQIIVDAQLNTTGALLRCIFSYTFIPHIHIPTYVCILYIY